MDNELSRNKNRTSPHFQDRKIVESNDNEIKFAKLTRESSTAYRSINTKPITPLHQPLWFWQKHSQWSYFKKGLFWGDIISCTAIFSAGCGIALTKINLVEKAIQRGLARQSVAEVLKGLWAKPVSALYKPRPVEGTVEGGGQVRASPSSHERLNQQRLKPHVAIAQRIEIHSNTRSSHQAVLRHSINLLLIEVEPDTNSMVKFSSTSIGKTKAILVLQFDPHNRVAKTINVPNTVRLSPPAPKFGGVRFVKVPQSWGI